MGIDIKGMGGDLNQYQLSCGKKKSRSYSMIDNRYEVLAQILLDHSLQIKKDDVFIISGSPLAAPLMYEVYRFSLVRGAHPITRIGLEYFSELFYQHAQSHQLKFISPMDKFEMKEADARLSIISPENTRYMTHIDPKKQALRSKSMQPIHDLFLKRAAAKDLRWCVTQFPTNASAQDAGMSLYDYERFIFDAAHIEEENPIQFWQSIGDRQEKLIDLLSKIDQVHIVAKDTDLRLSVNKRKWINCFGRENFPDGEIFTGPVEDSAEGHVRFSFPSVYGGRKVDDVKLFFGKGKVVRAESSSGHEYLESMLDADEGARRLGEFAFGMNAGITQFTKNTLFDEKIGGTIHLAVGSGYPETGSVNQSAIHWDMVLDLRKQGEIFADDECIFKNGSFVVEGDL